ncbi:Charged multivesicular body protein 5 [Cichlidogyrus casuarinus]|uniref:Charged multivesicular body protein 5 n=1 Tax=Cichlidogyrus casuarinus TaxID=1844966 RepID=A0ABD2QQG4_9PLAT
MNRIFGSGAAKKPTANLTDVVNNLDSRGGAYDKKVEMMNAQIAKITADMKKFKPGTPAHNSLKAKAMNLLRQRKVYEGHADNIRNQAFNISQAEMSIQNLKDTKDTVAAMKVGVKQFKKEYKKINIDKIADMQDELEDMLDQAGEIQTELGRNIGADSYNDADLEAELDALVDEQGLDSYFDTSIDVPSVPSALPGESVPAAQPSSSSTINGVAVDEFGLPQLPDRH